MPFSYYPRRRYYYNYRRRNPYQRRRRTRRRRRPFTFRTRKLVRRTYGRRRTVRRKFYYKRKKLKRLPLNQWQPKTIKKCKIKGYFCIIQCSQGRQSNNYTLYQTTRAPHNYASGGGFSILKFTLDSLFEDLQKLRNYWTVTNENLDLCRYTGCKIDFFRHTDISYVCTYSLCEPMEVHKLSNMQTHPLRLLLEKNKIIVPSFKDAPHMKKTYIRKKIRPPKLLVNKWFFQRDFAPVGLLLLHTSCASLNHMYSAINTTNNTAGLYCINPDIFQKANFANATGYYPNSQIYYFGTENGSQTPQPNDLIPLTSIIRTPGKRGSQLSNATKGNIFWHQYLHDDRQVFYSTKQSPSASEIKPLDKPIIYGCRYNAYDDFGTGNEIYVVNNLNESWDTKTTDLSLNDYPIWLGLWGLVDWWKKIRPGYSLDSNYAIVIKTKHIYPQLKFYVPLDLTFIDNKGPWGTDVTDLSAAAQAHWYPRLLFQQETLNNIALTGPAVAKAEYIKDWDLHIRYSFYFRWGGCPSKLVQIENPKTQPKYDIPDKLLIQHIQDPKEQTPSKITYDWDIRRGDYTETAFKRITKDSEHLQLSSTGRKRKPATDPETHHHKTKIQKILQETQDSETEEESEETPVQQQLQRLRNKQRFLTRNILQLINQLYQKQQRILPYTNLPE
nr:MAG: ORF1 [TTV-like mini virus]